MTFPNSLVPESIESSAAASQATWRLVSAVQELSLVRSLEEVMAVVRRAARELVEADGATFVLRDNGRCYYADEDAIAPLWKGQRFPMEACISGWAMNNRAPAVIEDIYVDSRIPIDAYRPTFVKSLAMIPIRSADPVGAIGTYWARHRRPTETDVRLLQALADTTSVAMENVQVYAELEQRVASRTRELEAINRELEAFSYSVSHDLRTPIRHITGFAELLERELGPELGTQARQYLARIGHSAQRMSTLIEDLLKLARLAQAPLTCRDVDLAALATDICDQQRANAPDRQVIVTINRELRASADRDLLRVALENLLANAWKYTSKRQHGVVEVGGVRQPDGELAVYVRDNGAGFDPTYAAKLFAPFQRLHTESEFPGNGVGLATVQRVIHRHGGRVWAESEPGNGATFWFTLPDATTPPASD